MFEVRRGTGELFQPLAHGEQLIVGLALAAIASSLRLPWLSEASGRSARAIGLLLPLPAIVGFGWALSLPSASIWPVALFWTGLAMHEVLWAAGIWRGRRLRGRRRTSAPRAQRDEPRDPLVTQPATLPTTPIAAAEPEPALQHVTQRIVRTREAEGETVTGLLRARLAVGERTHSLHVAFCPPLETTPTLQCEQTDGPTAALTLGEVHTYGARIDLRLSRPAAQPVAVTVEFYARG
jgi:hypothetical protein